MGSRETPKRPAGAVGVITATVIAAALAASCAGGPGGDGTPSGPSGSTAGSSAGPSVSTSSSPLATESNPPGDIPDNQVFVRYRPPGAAFTVTVPEGWARVRDGHGVRFARAVNSVRVEQTAASAALTPATARTDAAKRLGSGYRNVRVTSVSRVRRRSGTAVLVRFTADSPPDAVTGKVVVDDVQVYEFWRTGTLAVLTLAGPVKADNVDPWRTVTDSLRWR